jgi:adenylate cyclase
MVRPFKNGMLEQACPMADVLAEVASQLDELKVLRQQADFEMAPS